MRGELRIKPRTRRQEIADACHIAQVGHRLAGEDRIVRQAAFLRALDLAVPIGALHQPHHETAIERFGGGAHPRDHRARALLVGLNGEAETLPSGQRGIGGDLADHVEREFEPVGLLGVDGEIEIVLLGGAGEVEQPRCQFGQHALTRNRLIARMQRRELDRYSRPLRQGGIAGDLADGLDRPGIGIEIARGILRAARALAQHVEGIPEFAMGAGALQRLADGLPDDEMRAQQPHRLARRRSQGGQADPLGEVFENRLRRLARHG